MLQNWQHAHTHTPSTKRNEEKTREKQNEGKEKWEKRA